MRDQLGLLASLGYPNETCGVMLGKQAHGHVSVHKIEQIPYPEQDNEPFELDSFDLIQADSKAQRQGLEIVGIWRALPDQQHCPSEIERQTAWPHYSYLILSVTPHGISELHSWRLTSSRFTEEDLQL